MGWTILAGKQTKEADVQHRCAKLVTTITAYNSGQPLSLRLQRVVWREDHDNVQWIPWVALAQWSSRCLRAGALRWEWVETEAAG